VATVSIAMTITLTGCTGQAAEPRILNEGGPGLLITPEALRPDAPRIRGDLLTGGTLDLADLRGQVVLLNAYASWCPPCQVELPVLAEADRERPDLQVVGIDIADLPEAGLGVLTAAGADYPAFDDPRGLLLAAFTATPTRGLPFSVFIDAQGRVAGRIIGPATAGMIEEAMRRIAG